MTARRGTHGLDTLVQGRITRKPFWLTGRSVPATGWLHVPTDGLCRPNGVVYCPPVGYEYAHAHRTSVHLADALAACGIPVLRVDYPGTGNAWGDEATPELVEEWKATVRAAVEAMQKLTGAPPSLVGLRLGASIATAVAESVNVLGLGLWAPIAKGRRFEREVRALHAVAQEEEDGTPGSEASADFAEAGGFRYSDETLSAIRALDLTTSDPRADAVMLIEPASMPTPSKLVSHLEGLSVKLTRVQQNDFGDMVAEPQFATVPNRVIGRIVAWLQDIGPSKPTPISNRVIEQLFGQRCSETETLVVVPRKPPVTGILNHADESRDLIVLLPNAGSVHHAGPNRLYVELARALADVRTASLRLDLRNLGDSRIGSSPEENHPYPSTAVDDIEQVADWLTSDLGYENVVIAGLCSGAHTALHAARDVEDGKISAAIAINPLTFNFRIGMTLDTPATEAVAKDTAYYRGAIRDLKRWGRLFRGEVDLKYIAGFVVRYVGQRTSSGWRGLLRLLRIAPPSFVESLLDGIAVQERSVHFVFADTDPGPELLRSQGGATIRRLIGDGSATRDTIIGGDHTFSRKKERKQAIAAVVERSASLRRAPAISREDLGPATAAWPELAPIWSRLVAERAETSAFLSASWIAACLEYERGARSAKAFLWRGTDGEVVGSAIVWKDRGKLGPFPVSRSLLNSPGVLGLGTERNDVLVLADYTEAVRADLSALLESEAADEVDLIGVRSELLRSLRSSWPRGYWNGYESIAPRVSLDCLSDGEDAYLSSLSSNTRSQIRRSIRLYAEEYGDPKYEVARTPEKAQAWFDELLNLHDARWRARDVQSGFPQEARRFHSQLIERHCVEVEPDRLRADVARVTFGETPVGYLYHLVFRLHVHFVQSGFMYEEDGRLKPGMVSHFLSIQDAIDSGLQTYDFLGGAAEPVRYASSLSNSEAKLAWAQLPAPTLRMDLLEGMRRAKRRLSSQK